MANAHCPKCHGKGYVKEEDGSVHTCFTCLMDGNMDQHTDEALKESHIKI